MKIYQIIIINKINYIFCMSCGKSKMFKLGKDGGFWDTGIGSVAQGTELNRVIREALFEQAGFVGEEFEGSEEIGHSGK